MIYVDYEHYQTNILSSLLKEYDSKDIFNGDKFGFFSNVHLTKLHNSMGIIVTEGKRVKNA